MKTLKTLCAALVLTLVLGLPALAGEISTTGAEPSPPPATADGQISTTGAGHVHTGVAGQIQTGMAGNITTMSSEIYDPVTQMALPLLHSVLSLF